MEETKIFITIQQPIRHAFLNSQSVDKFQRKGQKLRLEVEGCLAQNTKQIKKSPDNIL